MRTFFVAMLTVALSGCATERPAGGQAAAGKPAEGQATGPELIAELTNQTEIYECPVCKMMFAGPGTCSMGCAELVRTQVSYVCAADQKPVDRAGDCPRCDVDAQIVKTAMTNAPPPAVSGN